MACIAAMQKPGCLKKTMMLNLGLYQKPATRKGNTMDNLKNIVDQLGVLKAQIAEFTKLEKALIDQIKSSGYSEIDGFLYRAAVSWTERVTLNADRVREVLSAEDIAYCEQKAEVMSVRVSARKKAAA